MAPMDLRFAAAGGAQDALVALFVVLLAAKVGEEICRRIGQPAIVGEILAGVVIGPSVLGRITPDEVLEVFSELAVLTKTLGAWIGAHGVESRDRTLIAVGMAVPTTLLAPPVLRRHVEARPSGVA